MIKPRKIMYGMYANHDTGWGIWIVYQAKT